MIPLFSLFKRLGAGVLCLNSLAALHAATPFGVNASNVDWVDVVKGTGGFSSLNSNPLPLDDSGWPQADCSLVVFDQRRNMPWDGPDPHAQQFSIAGTYHISFNGEAIVSASTEYPNDTTGVIITNQKYNAQSNTTTLLLTIAPQRFLVILTFSNTIARPGAAVGSGFTNLHVIRPGYPANTQQAFTTQTRRAYSSVPFAAYRMLDVDATNSYAKFCGTDLATATWDARVQVTDAYQGGLPIPRENDNTVGHCVEAHGYAWEYIIQMVNMTQGDIWINVPVSADDDYVTQLAMLLKNGNQYTAPLAPGKHIYLEYSNEVWNFGFFSAVYNQNKAQAEGISNDQRYLERLYQISQLFAQVYGEGSLLTIIRPVALWQYTTELTFFNSLGWLEKRVNAPVKSWLWGIGEAPYYNPTDTSSVDNIINTLYTGSDATRRDFVNWQAVAAYYGIREVGYESGPSLNSGIGSDATRDPRIAATEVHHFLQNWFAVGGDLVNFFALKSYESPFGDWLLIEDYSQLNTPKMRGARQILAARQPSITAGHVLPWYAGSVTNLDPSQRVNDPFSGDPVPGSSLTVAPGSANVYLLRSPGNLTYAITLTGTRANSNSQVAVYVDDQLLGTVTLPSGKAGAAAPVDVTLTPGFHGLQITAVSSNSTISNIAIQALSGSGTPIVPSAPTNLSVTSINPNQIALTWATTGSATSYNVLRSTQSGGPYSIIGSSAVNNYTDNAVNEGTLYYYAVSAVNSVGEGAASAQIPVMPTAQTPPAAPSSLTVQGYGGQDTFIGPGGMAQLSWNPVPDAIAYQVLRSTVSGSGYSTVATVMAPSYLDNDGSVCCGGGLQKGQTYYYVIKAVNTFGASAPSEEVSVTPVELPPGAPTNVTAQVVGHGAVALNWTPPPGMRPQFSPNQYNVQRSTSPNGPFTTLFQVNVANAVDTTVIPGETYYYTISAAKEVGPGPNSPVIGVTP